MNVFDESAVYITLKVEAKGPSETSVISTRLHGVTHKKAVKFY
jgi:hypothetical protein